MINVGLCIPAIHIDINSGMQTNMETTSCSVFHIESNGHTLLIKGKDRLSSLQEIKMMLSFAKDLSLLLNAQAAK